MIRNARAIPPAFNSEKVDTTELQLNVYMKVHHEPTTPKQFYLI